MATTATTLSPEVLSAFVALASGLSPENLFADGERSKSAAARVKRGLVARWKALEKEVGRKVSEDEVWHAWISRPRPTGVGQTYA